MKRRIYNDVTNPQLKEQHKPHILDFNPHPFYSFRGPKNQMRIRIGADLIRGRELDFLKRQSSCT